MPNNEYAKCAFSKTNLWFLVDRKHYFCILVAMVKITYKTTSTRLSIGFMDISITDDGIINAIISITSMTQNDYFTISQDRITKGNLIIVKWFKKLTLTLLKTISIDIAMISLINHLLKTIPKHFQTFEPYIGWGLATSLLQTLELAPKLSEF